MSMSGCRNRLNMTSPSAPAAASRSIMLPGAEKNGSTLTATGMSMASLTAETISMWRSSISGPLIPMSGTA